MNRLRIRLFAHLSSQEIGFFDCVRTGELMNRLSEVCLVLMWLNNELALPRQIAGDRNAEQGSCRKGASMALRCQKPCADYWIAVLQISMS